jgi:hypothetical protein
MSLFQSHKKTTDASEIKSGKFPAGVNVAGLSGLLADDQHVLDAEVTAVAIPLTQKGAASGVASLDASSVVVQQPPAHKTRHQAGGADELDLTGLVASVPSGLIAIWHGLIANIPSGWVICDGNNSSPDLLAKFVEGVATAATNPGTTGGATSKTTAGHVHAKGSSGSTYFQEGAGYQIPTATDTISDIRPPFYDVAYIMKT